MKKILIFLLVFSLLFALSLPLHAQVSGDETKEMTEEEKRAYDSVALSDEERAAYANSPEDTVIKIYGRPNFLIQDVDISEFLRNEYFNITSDDIYLAFMCLAGAFPITYYISVSPEGEVTYALKPVESEIQPDFENRGDFTSIYEYLVNPTMVFGEKVKVYHTYCIGNEYMINPAGNDRRCEKYVNNGLFVYYETNCGDYILWDIPLAQVNHTFYIFTVEEFTTYREKLCAYMEEDPPSDYAGGGYQYKLPEELGMTSYALSDFVPPEPPSEPVVPSAPEAPAEAPAEAPEKASYVWIPFAAVGAAAVLGGAWFAVRKKKR